MTEVIVTASTVIAYSTIDTDISVRTVFAVFAALWADVGTFRAARTAGTAPADRKGSVFLAWHFLPW